MTCLLLALALLGAPEVLAGSGLGLELAAFRGPDSTLRVELVYSVPYSALTFVREDSAFAAAFVLRVQCWDDKRRLVRAKDWTVTIGEGDYDRTVDPAAVVRGVRQFAAPQAKLQAEVVFQDLHSERSQQRNLLIEPPRYLSDVRLSPARPLRRAMRGVPGDTAKAAVSPLERLRTAERLAGERSRTEAGLRLESRDTLKVEFTAYSSGLTGAAESVVVLVRARGGAGRQPVMGEERRAIAAAAADSLGTPMYFDFPLQRFWNGTYEVVATAGSRPDAQGREERRAVFQVLNSFFQSDYDYRERVAELIWIATEDELQVLRGAAPAQRESVWTAFWTARDPTPTTGENEAERTYFERINYSILHFSHGDQGFRSDRARVYVKLGPPDNVESAPYELDSHPYEVWTYYSLSLHFKFLDVSGFGEYKLVEPADYFRR
jgi:GWxTD domain-containing protein